MHIGYSSKLSTAITRAKRWAKKHGETCRVYCGTDANFHITTEQLTGEWPVMEWNEIDPDGSVYLLCAERGQPPTISMGRISRH